MNGKSEITEKYLGLYKDNIGEISGISSPFINGFRASAFEKFSELGIPSKKNEAYKYSKQKRSDVRLQIWTLTE